MAQVSFAPPRFDWGKRPGARTLCRSPMAKVFVADLPPHFNDATTQQVFNAYGTISSLRMMPLRKEGDKAACIIDFADAGEAEWIVTNLNGNIAEGLTEPVVVRFANSTKGKAKGDGKGWGKAAGQDAGYGVSAGAATTGSNGSWGADGAASGSTWSGSGDWNAGGSGSWGGQEDGSGYGKSGKGQSWGGKNASAPYDGKGGGKKGGKDPHGARALVDAVADSGAQGDTSLRPEDQCVYIRGLPSDTTDLDLYKLFAVFGAIPHRGVKAMKNQDGTCTSVGFVDFTTPEAAQAAISALKDYPMPDGNSLFLKTKNPHGSGKGGGKGKQQGWQGDDGGKGKSWQPPPPPGPAPAQGAARAALPPAPPPPVRPSATTPPAPALAA
uniref:RRM domain-containing protein n=1 Tax=Alexandrium catenella TaxID=2925 RepID=A0A7S1KW41_ALECA